MKVWEFVLNLDYVVVCISYLVVLIYSFVGTDVVDLILSFVHVLFVALE
jgi:hypothetical protein